MKQFKSEADMQYRLLDRLKHSDGLAEFIINKNYLDRFAPQCIEHTIILKSFKSCFESLYEMELISNDENISLNKPDILRPDLILYSHSTEGIVIVELKNIKNPTRQAGTEFNAYSSEIKSHLPFISDGDIYNVIISNEYPPLLIHYIFHEIFWKQRNFLCLTPSYSSQEVNLEILSIDRLYQSNMNNNSKISDKSITGYQICLYDYSNYDSQINTLDKNIEEMKTSLTVMKSEGVRQHSHGFAILWKNRENNAISPYFITLCNLSAFTLFNDSVCGKTRQPSLLQNKIFRIVNDNCPPTGHSSTLFKITESGYRFLKSFCNPKSENSVDWKHLHREMLTMYEELISFQGWGVFGELFNERLIDRYSKGNTGFSSDDPRIGMEILRDIIDPNYEHSGY